MLCSSTSSCFPFVIRPSQELRETQGRLITPRWKSLQMLQPTSVEMAQATDITGKRRQLQSSWSGMECSFRTGYLEGVTEHCIRDGIRPVQCSPEILARQ